jgi:hypothetical protein
MLDDVRYSQAVSPLAEAAIELAIENRIYRQMCGELSLPQLPDPGDVKAARAQLVKLRAVLNQGDAPKINEVLEEVIVSLRQLRT